MTQPDYDDLCKRLRSDVIALMDVRAAADAIEAQDKTIAELREQSAKYQCPIGGTRPFCSAGSCYECVVARLIDSQSRTEKAEGLANDLFGKVSAANDRVLKAEADNAALREYILAANEVRELLDRTLEAAPGFPLSQCSPDELEKWQDAMHTVLMNLGLWRVATDAYPVAAALLAGKESVK